MSEVPLQDKAPEAMEAEAEGGKEVEVDPPPCTLHPTPQIRNQKPETRDPKPETRIPKPETETLNPTLNPKP